MSEQIPEAQVDSTPTKDDSIAPDGRTQELFLIRILYRKKNLYPKSKYLK